MKSTRKIKIIVGLPVYDREEPLFVRSLPDAVSVRGGVLRVQRVVGTNTPNARNLLVDLALRENATYLLFADVDMVHPRGGLESLLRHNLDIVGGYYHGVYQGYPPMAFVKGLGKSEDYKPFLPKQGLIEVDLIGTGFLLVKTKVFRKLDYPYFNYSPEVDGKTGQHFMTTEDVYFCRKASEAGFAIFCDTNVRSGHIGKFVVMPHDTENRILFKPAR